MRFKGQEKAQKEPRHFLKKMKVERIIVMKKNTIEIIMKLLVHLGSQRVLLTHRAQWKMYRVKLKCFSKQYLKLIPRSVSELWNYR